MVNNFFVKNFYRDANEAKKILDACSFLALDAAKTSLQETVARLKSPLQVMVMGAFSTGKSSFVNALLGENVTAVEALPTTAVITKLTYGNNDNVLVHFQDGTTQSYTTIDFVRMTNENNASWSTVREKTSYVERRLPLEMLKSINIIDSPGLEAKDIHTKITRKFVNHADVVFWMFSAENAGTGTELKAIGELNSRLLPIAIINKMDTLDEEEDDPEEFLQDVQHKLEGKVRSVIGISAQSALKGRASGDHRLLQESNISQVEKVINTTIIPQSDEFKINSFMEDMAEWLITVEEIVSKHIKYSKNTATPSEYAITKKNSEDFFRDICAQLERLSNYAKKEAAAGNGSACVFTATHIASQSIISEQNSDSPNILDEYIRYLTYGAEKNNLMAQAHLSSFYFLMGAHDKASYWANIVNERFVDSVDLPDMQGMIQFILGSLAIRKGDYRTGYALLEKAVENDSTDAANNLGFAYQHGKGIEVDYKKALKYYKIAAENDESVAQYNLGFMYYNGLGIAANQEKALKWIKTAAENDYSTAQYSLGTFYWQGDCGLSQNSQEAIKWFKLTMEHNDNSSFDAQAALVLLYAGIPDEKAADFSQGITVGEQFYEKYKYVEEQREEVINILPYIGMMYKQMGNPLRSVYWFKIAAEAGVSAAQYALGIAYVDNDGIPVDYDKARYWLEKAAAQGNEAAIRDLAELNAMMNATTNQSNNQVTPSEDSDDDSSSITFHIIAAVVLMIFFLPVGIVYTIWLIFYKVPKVNEELAKRKGNKK